MVEQGVGLEMKKQGGKSGWQQGYEENKRNFDRFNKQVCGKCKDPRHTTKDCRVGHCLICGRENHITGECNLLKQVKPVPKYVGYAATGLGILLVQSYKDVLIVEHEEEFSYSLDAENGPAHWGDIKEEWSACGKGNMQSPIDLAGPRVSLVRAASAT